MAPGLSVEESICLHMVPEFAGVGSYLSQKSLAARQPRIKPRSSWYGRRAQTSTLSAGSSAGRRQSEERAEAPGGNAEKTLSWVFKVTEEA